MLEKHLANYCGTGLFSGEAEKCVAIGSKSISQITPDLFLIQFIFLLGIQ